MWIDEIKAHPLAWGLGAIVVIFVGYIVIDGIRTGGNTPSSSSFGPSTPPTAAPAQVAGPRGKLPWAIGDVNLWDDEDDRYCSGCSRTCGSSVRTDQCQTCKARCPMN